MFVVFSIDITFLIIPSRSMMTPFGLIKTLTYSYFSPGLFKIRVADSILQIAPHPGQKKKHHDRSIGCLNAGPIDNP